MRNSKYKPKSWYITVINIAKKQLEMDEKNYRDTLETTTKKRSLKQMSIPELVKVLSHMEKIGFKLQKSSTSKAKQSPKSSHKSEDTKTDLDKLRQIWIEMNKQGFLKDGSDTALEKWARNLSPRYNKGVAIEKLEWLTPKVKYNLIEQLKQWHKRVINKVLPETYSRVSCFKLEGYLTNEQIIEFEGHRARMLEAPETHSVLSDAHRFFIDTIRAHDEKDGKGDQKDAK